MRLSAAMNAVGGVLGPPAGIARTTLNGTEKTMMALQLFKAGILSKTELMEILELSNLRARTKQEATALAEADGLVAFFPTDKELFLDYDEPFEIAVAKGQASLLHSPVVKILEKHITFKSWLWTRSKSGNAHLYIQLEMGMGYEHRMLLQSLLGSDKEREAYNLVRRMVPKEDKDPYCMALFETKDEAKSVRKWRVQDKIDECRKRIEGGQVGKHVADAMRELFQ